MKTKFILFDFDGVIADSFDIAFETAQVRCPAISEDAYRKRFEGNIHEIKHEETFHTDKCNHDLEWFSIYVPKMMESCTLFPGIKEIIYELENDYMMIIISSTITSPIEEFIARHELQNHFDWVMGSDVHKSKVEKIKMVFDKYNIEAKDCIFITDTSGDMKEAADMGVPSIGVTWGFCKVATLEKGAPLKLVHTPQELKSAITELLPV